MDPKHIGPYRIDRRIGAGGMGTVYLATHEKSGQQAAVKVLPPMLAREPGFLARFEREVSALRKLNQPNVVQLYESGTDGDVPFYAMEYVDGETLMDRLKKEKRIPWQEVIVLAVQICGALKAAHNAGIIHRDLKPSNLLLTKEGTIKLTDFGVAQVFASGKLTVTGGVIGTAEYMSPEQAAGRRAEKRSDIYSLGAVMYVMLTGRPPFTGKTTFDVARLHQHGRFDSPRMIVPELPYWLDEVVCKCLEKKPDDRYPDAYVLSRRLEEIPKKVELAAQDQAVEFDLSSPTAETLAASAKDADAALRGDGPPEVGATLMRDLVKAQLEQQTQPATRVARALDNTWILIGLLALVIGGGVLWFQNVHRQSLPDGTEPMLSAHAEVDAFLKRAEHERKTGRFAAATATLDALEAILPAGEAYARDRRQIATEREKIKSARPEAEYLLLQTALVRASELHERGETASARSVWRGVLDLYDADDPAARDGLNEARRLLAETEPTGDSTDNRRQ